MKLKVGDLAMWRRGVGSWNSPPGIIIKVSEEGTNYLIHFPDTGTRRWCTEGLLKELIRPLTSS